ncbi:polymorphic toxin type 44 domain-containing protein [Chitinophaga sp. 22321]
MGNNPIRYLDPNGKKFINFDAAGNYTGTTKDNWWHNLWHGSKGRIVDNQGQVTQKFSFADPKNDVKDIQSGVIKRVEFVKESDIRDMMSRAGVFDSENKLENRNSRYEYIREQGQGGGGLDFSYRGIHRQFPEASASPVNKPSSMIFLVDGVAHNHMNFGNFLFGAAGAALGLSLPELLGGGHYNSLVNTKENNYSSQPDSMDDQYSIMKGFEHGYINYYKEIEYSGKVEFGPLLPISVF